MPKPLKFKRKVPKSPEIIQIEHFIRGAAENIRRIGSESIPGIDHAFLAHGHLSDAKILLEKYLRTRGDKDDGR